MFRMTIYIYYDEMSVCDVSSSFSAVSSTKSFVMLFCIAIGNVDVIEMEFKTQSQTSHKRTPAAGGTRPSFSKCLDHVYGFV